MKKILLPFLFLVFATALVGQNTTFQQIIGTTGNESGHSAIQTSFGEYVIVSNFYDSSFVGKILVVKVNSSGNILWSNTYSNYSDNAVQVIESVDKNFVVLGNSDSCLASSDVILMKVDKNSGAVLWSRVYSGPKYDMSFSVNETSDNGFIIGGSYYTSLNGPQTLIIKTDSMGFIQWSKIYSFIAGVGKVVVKQLADGNYMSTGYYYNTTSGSMDMFLIKISTTGNVIWAKSYGTTSNNDEGASSLSESPEGYIYVTGTRSTSAVYGELLIAKFSAVGSIKWVKSYGGSGVMQDEWSRDGFYSNGKITAVGFTSSYTPGQNFYLVSADTMGNIISTKTFVGAEAWSVTGTDFGGLLICGYTGTNSFGNTDIYLVKTDSLFNSGCFETSNVDTFQTVPLSWGSVTLSVTNVSLYLGNCSYTAQNFAIYDSLLCQTVGINNINIESKIVLYPNPTSGIFTVTSQEEITAIEIYNVLGEKVESLQVESSIVEIDLSEQAKGIYFVKIVSDNKVTSQKIIIQ